MGPSFILFFEEGRRVWDHNIHEDGVFFQDRLETAVMTFLLEVKSKVVVLHGNLHRSEGLFWVSYPALRLLNQLARDLDRTKVELEAFLGLRQVRHYNQRAAQIEVEARAVGFLLQVELRPKIVIKTRFGLNIKGNHFTFHLSVDLG